MHLAAGAALALGGGWSWRNIYRPEVEHHEATLDGLQVPLRLVQLSDLHIGPYLHEGSLNAWVDLTLAQDPDLIVITGDIIDSWFYRSVDILTGPLSQLRAPLGVYAVWGNHDRGWSRNITPLAGALQEAEIEILNNRGKLIREDLYLAGIDDWRQGHPNIMAALRDYPAGVASLLLSHNPDALPHIPSWLGLTLCGHTHGGQIRLPLLGAPLTSSRYGQRFAQGWVEGPARGYVSRGLGATMLPLRINCPPELTVMQLVP